jgi:uncharacterized protein DUF11/beta-propeller repeat-containing protein
MQIRTGIAALVALLLLPTAFATGPATADGATAPGTDAIALTYLEYFGAGSLDFITGVAVGPNGHTYVTGTTLSDDLPTTPAAFQPTKPSPLGFPDGFVAEIDTAANRVLYATYLGGTGDDAPSQIAVDAAGNAYVAGRTASTDFPVTASAFEGDQPQYDTFLAKLDPSGSQLLYSTYLGGASDDEWATGVAAGTDGTVFVVGFTASSDFPTTEDALQTRIGSDETAFVAKIDTNASGPTSLVYSTFYGGNGATSAMAVALGANGVAYVSGSANATDLIVSPTAYQGALTGAFDAYVLVLDVGKPGADGLSYASYYGGEGGDYVTGVAEHDGLVYVSGETSSVALPTTPGAYRTQPSATTGSSVDGFLAVLDPSQPGSAALRYATYYGGAKDDEPLALAVDAAGNAWIAGTTFSDDFPTTADAAGHNAPDSDAFVVEIAPSLSGADGLAYATYLGGGAADTAYAAVAGPGGRVTVAGQTLSANLPGPGHTPAPGNGDGFVAELVAPTTDLALAASPFTPDPAPRGSTQEVTLTVTNEGPDPARGVMLSYDVPGGTRFDSALDGGGTPLPISSGTPGPIRIDVGRLTPGASSTYTLRLFVEPDAGGEITQSASVSSATIDTDPSNDTFRATVRAITYPVFGTAKLVKPPVRLVIKGAAFQPGAQVFVGDDAAPWPSTRLKGSAQLTLKGRGLKDRFPKGAAVSLRVVNPDGGSVTGSFTR